MQKKIIGALGVGAVCMCLMTGCSNKNQMNSSLSQIPGANAATSQQAPNSQDASNSKDTTNSQDAMTSEDLLAQSQSSGVAMIPTLTPIPEEELNQALQPTTVPDEQKQEMNQAVEKDIIDITEKMYVTWINEIYTNAEDYIGKTIRIQGMYSSYTPDDVDTTYHYVYREGPGCCGNDGSMCGFEFTYDGAFPTDNDWIELTGVVDVYEEDGYHYLTVRASKITVMQERGAESVYQ